MRERPIIFSGEMVRAILEGRKTQTRRVVKPQPPLDEWGVSKPWQTDAFEVNGRDYRCPYGLPGDRLWVRETFSPDYFDAQSRHAYRADWTLESGEFVPEPKWTPSIHMPRWASRITLEVTDVRVERVQDISNSDIYAEGILPPDPDEPGPYDPDEGARSAFKDLWWSINAKRGYGWEKNPWVWVVEFKRVESIYDPY